MTSSIADLFDMGDASLESLITGAPDTASAPVPDTEEVRSAAPSPNPVAEQMDLVVKPTSDGTAVDRDLTEDDIVNLNNEVRSRVLYKMCKHPGVRVTCMTKNGQVTGAVIERCKTDGGAVAVVVADTMPNMGVIRLPLEGVHEAQPPPDQPDLFTNMAVRSDKCAAGAVSEAAQRGAETAVDPLAWQNNCSDQWKVEPPASDMSGIYLKQTDGLAVAQQAKLAPGIEYVTELATSGGYLGVECKCIAVDRNKGRVFALLVDNGKRITHLLEQVGTGAGDLMMEEREEKPAKSKQRASPTSTKPKPEPTYELNEEGETVDKKTGMVVDVDGDLKDAGDDGEYTGSDDDDEQLSAKARRLGKDAQTKADAASAAREQARAERKAKADAEAATKAAKQAEREQEHARWMAAKGTRAQPGDSEQIEQLMEQLLEKAEGDDEECAKIYRIMARCEQLMEDDIEGRKREFPTGRGKAAATSVAEPPVPVPLASATKADIKVSGGKASVSIGKVKASDAGSVVSASAPSDKAIERPETQSPEEYFTLIKTTATKRLTEGGVYKSMERGAAKLQMLSDAIEAALLSTCKGCPGMYLLSDAKFDGLLEKLAAELKLPEAAKSSAHKLRTRWVNKNRAALSPSLARKDKAPSTPAAAASSSAAPDDGAAAPSPPAPPPAPSKGGKRRR
jgi:hypothetical protein